MNILLSSIASLFAVATVFNMRLLSFNKQSDATLEAIIMMIKANGENNKHKAVGSIGIGDGSELQYKEGDMYYSYTQTATKYYDSDSNTHYYEVNKPRINVTSNKPIRGAILHDPLETGFRF